MTYEEIKAKVNDCNNKLHDVDGRLESFDVSNLQGYSDELAEAWQTENGENTIRGLNNVIRSLNNYTDDINEEIEQIKGETVTFTLKEEETTTFIADIYY